jgi:hypothetical protein
MQDSLPQEMQPGTAIHTPISGVVSIDGVLMRFSDLVCHVLLMPLPLSLSFNTHIQWRHNGSSPT